MDWVVVSFVLLADGDPEGHLRVVVVQKEPQTNLMHLLGLAERERLAHEPRQPLAQGIVEALDVVGLPAAFAYRNVLRFGNNLLVSVPEVRERHGTAQKWRHLLPEQAAGRFAAVSNRKSDDLACAAAQGEPDPALVLAASHKRPQLIEFQHIVCLGRSERFTQQRQAFGFF